PLTINFSEGSYRDKIDIQPEEVYRRLPTEIPTSSQPSPQEIAEVFERVVADGYEKVVAVTISSGLSGTFDNVSAVARENENLDVIIIDTLSIGLGAGFTAIAAGELIARGVAFEELEDKLTNQSLNTKIFFGVETLKYLKAGGRIGEVAYILGNLLGIRPIITCGSDGKYHIASKARGRDASIKRMIDLARDVAATFREYNVAVMHGDAADEVQKILAEVRTLFPRVKEVFTGQISPALVVHTGPGLVGIGIQGLVR
ncbi:MAG: DegV family protein, partial [Oscillospiraceae bacterium]|nr:DegV family protein [Oscillospiraceae bacterium]